MKKPPKKPSLSNTVKKTIKTRAAKIETDDGSYSHFIEAASLLDPMWMEDAACTDLESKDFFPLNPNHHDPSLLVARTCLACPVRKECLYTIAAMEAGRWADKGQKGRGFFAGLNPSSRRTIYHQPKEQWFELATSKLKVFITMGEAIEIRRVKRLASVGKPIGRPKKGAK